MKSKPTLFILNPQNPEHLFGEQKAAWQLEKLRLEAERLGFLREHFAMLKNNAKKSGFWNRS